MMGEQNQIKPYLYNPNFVLRVSIIIILSIITLSGLCRYLFGLNLVNHLPSFSLCPFHAVTGIQCPGCGMMRAMLYLGQLKIYKAIQLNPFSLPLLFAMILYAVLGKIPFALRCKNLPFIMLVTALGFWMLRLIL